MEAALPSRSDRCHLNLLSRRVRERVVPRSVAAAPIMWRPTIGRPRPERSGLEGAMGWSRAAHGSRRGVRTVERWRRGPGSWRVRDLRSADGPALAALHVEAFPTFFLTTLGERFLKRFYRSLLSQPWGFGVGLVRNGACQAFAAGASIDAGFYRRLARADAVGLVAAAVPALACHPSRLVHIARSLGGSACRPTAGDAVLLSICVAPAAEGSGLGSSVLRKFEHRAAARGCRGVVLTTDTDGNERANNFYRSNGYELESTSTTAEGRRMNCYRKAIPPET